MGKHRVSSVLSVLVALPLVVSAACSSGPDNAGQGGGGGEPWGAGGSSGTAGGPSDPTTRTQAMVCTAWKDGHVENEPSPLVASGAMCDAGSLEAGAIADTLRRLNMYRWFSGLGPADADPMYNDGAQQCANLEAWWDFNAGGNPHAPPSNTPCYTDIGAQTAGQSNIAWGSGTPANAMDQFVEDNGNASTMGHRRWIVNPPLGPVGVGFWKTGGAYGNAMCLRIFASNGTGPKPPWVAVPNQGFTPINIALWPWTFHGADPGIPNAQISMTRVGDGAALGVTIQKLQQGFGENAISWLPSGWTPEVGQTYRVTVSGLQMGDVTYEVKPISCQ